MSKSEIQKIKQAIAKILNEPEINILPDSKSDDFDKWDSFAHVKIILEIENITNKSISAGRIGNINSIRSILSLLS